MNILQISIFILFCFTSFYEVKGDGCYCLLNQTVKPDNPYFSLGPPTTNGEMNGTNCAANCSSIINMADDIENGQGYGSQISIVECSGFVGGNTLTIYEDQNVFQVFRTCPGGIFRFTLAYPHVYTITWNLVSPVYLTFIQQPFMLVSSTTANPPLQSTLPYQGVFSPNNPAISRMDLTIGLDTNSANEQFFNNSREVITNIVKYFTYSSDFVRLSFITFDPFAAAGTGKFPLWSLNSFIAAEELNNMPFYPGKQSRYAEVLDTFFFNQLADFPLRPNTERVFIILTGTDAAPAKDNFVKIKTEINNYDIKFIFINLNTNVTTTNPANFPYPNMKKITGTLSNKAHWYDYQLNQNNAENILAKLYFNGNTLCNRPNGSPYPLIPNDIPLYYSIPQDPTKLYCNYMDNTQTYVNANMSYTISVTINKYDLKNVNDVLIITADGSEVSRLTNYGSDIHYCLKNSNVTITLKTKDGLVFTGYQSHVSAVSDADCKSKSLKILK